MKSRDCSLVLAFELLRRAGGCGCLCEPAAGEGRMPEKKTIRKARKDKRQGKAASTQAGEFVHEEIRHVRKGKHGARSTKQAIAIGLSKARRAGVKLPAPKKGTASAKTRSGARSALKRAGKKASPARSRATSAALRREGHTAASKPALARQARSSARKRGAGARSAASKKASRTKGSQGRAAAARKAARTRARRSR
jgi:hypothetical protein